jgi:hypothetical protein
VGKDFVFLRKKKMGKRGREREGHETGHKVPKIHSEGRSGGVEAEREEGEKKKTKTRKVQGANQRQERSEKEKGESAALHPFEHDPADDCETCFQAYQDIWWVLTLPVT